MRSILRKIHIQCPVDCRHMPMPSASAKCQSCDIELAGLCKESSKANPSASSCSQDNKGSVGRPDDVRTAPTSCVEKASRSRMSLGMPEQFAGGRDPRPENSLSKTRIEAHTAEEEDIDMLRASDSTMITRGIQ